ncbi:MAG: tetratricopeptide repeat protein [Polyangiaceae bacterium]|nr:tetratricopeptide repeat protein [Polyangiaceae bacterium]MCL4755500.1 tetratricopeptide repeat protein [Myxococcales bacterium]
MRPWLAAGLVCLACGSEQPPARAPSAQPPLPPPPGLYSENHTPTPLGTAPACAPGAPCTPPVAPTASASAKAPEPPPPEPPKAGKMPGGLSRGTGDALDAALFEGDKAYAADQLKSAKQHYEKAKKLAPKDPAPEIGLVRVALAESGVATDFSAAPKDKKILALEKRVAAVIKTHAGYGPARVERGRLLLILGEADKALAELEKGVALEPTDPESHSALGVALLATGKAEQALSRFRRAAELDRDNPARLANLGTAYMMRGQVEEAIKAYERAVALAPNDPRARGDLGTAYLAANKADQALPHLEQAVKLAPDRATFLSNLGYAQQQRGELDKAIATYQLALKKDDKLGSAWINLGTALAQKGKLDEAESAFKKAQALDPSDPRVKANLEELAELRKKKGKP